MGILNSNQLPIGHFFNSSNDKTGSSGQSAINGQNDTRDRADCANRLENAIAETANAIMALGKAYFEKAKDDPDPEFGEQIANVKMCMEKEKLLAQYKLSLEGKMLCEACGATITSDSLFCNKCGAKVTPPDFSSIEPKMEETATAPRVCPVCGAVLQEDAMFCEKCGASVGDRNVTAGSEQEMPTAPETCPDCGSAIIKGAKFCEKCGKRL